MESKKMSKASAVLITTLVIGTTFVGCTTGKKTGNNPFSQMASDVFDDKAKSDKVGDGSSYKDPDPLIEERVEDLLSRMTLEEKVGQMWLITSFDFGATSHQVSHMVKNTISAQ